MRAILANSPSPVAAAFREVEKTMEAHLRLRPNESANIGRGARPFLPFNESIANPESSHLRRGGCRCHPPLTHARRVILNLRGK